MANKTSTTTVRLDPELLESLKVKANEDGRSLNNIINRVLDNFVKKSKETKTS